jgi:hypothetical protein
MLLRCTSRLLQTISGTTEPALNTAAPASVSDFYANLTWIERRKCLFVTHAGTLFSIFTSDVRANDLRPLGRFVVPLIKDALNSEGLPSNTLGDLVADDAELSKTADRSVLGCMNEMAWFSELAIMDAGNIRLLDVAQLNHELRRLIFRTLGPPLKARVLDSLEPPVRSL